MSTSPRRRDTVRRELHERRLVVVGAAALVVPYGFALVLVPFRDTFANAAAALTFVAVITSHRHTR